MATTLNAYSVSLGLAAGGFVDGAKLARGEAASLTRTLSGLADPAEKIAKKMDLVERAYKQGAIGADVHGQAVDRLKAKLHELEPAIVQHESRFASLGRTIKTAVAAYIGFNLVNRVKTGVTESLDDMDKLATRATMLGESAKELQKFEFAMSQMANLDAERASDALSKLSKNIGLAATGGKVAEENFARVGLSIGQLLQLSPVEQFEAVAAAFSKIENPAVRIAEATRLFGKSGAELIPILTQSSSEYAKVVEQAEKLNVLIDDTNVERLAEANDKLEMIQRAFGMIYTKIAVDLTPAIDLVLENLDKFKAPLEVATKLVTLMLKGFTAIAAILSDIIGYFEIGTQVLLGHMKAVDRLVQQHDKLHNGNLFPKFNLFLDSLDEADRRAGKLLDTAKKLDAVLPKSFPDFPEWTPMPLSNSTSVQGMGIAGNQFAKEIKIKLESPPAMAVGSADAYKFFAERDNKKAEEQIRIANAHKNLAANGNVLLAEVRDGVKDLRDNIKRKR